jgi:hypothetical protein
MPLTHSMLPRPVNKPVPRSQIKTAAQIRDYASGGFHVCVDNANREAPGSARFQAWELAGSQYLAAFQLGAAGVVAPAALQAALAKLAQADMTAAQAKAMGPSTPKSPPPAQVDPSPDAPPVSEQIGPSGGLASIMANIQTTTIAGFPLWAILLGVGGMILWKKFGKGGGKGRRAMRRASRRPRRMRSSRRLRGYRRNPGDRGKLDRDLFWAKSSRRGKPMSKMVFRMRAQGMTDAQINRALDKWSMEARHRPRSNPGRRTKGPHRIKKWKTSARMKLRAATMSDKELIKWFEKGEKYSRRHSRKHKRPGTKGRPPSRAHAPAKYTIKRRKKR